MHLTAGRTVKLEFTCLPFDSNYEMTTFFQTLQCPVKEKKEKLYILVKKSRKVGALFSYRLKSLNFVSLRLNLEVFKAAQSKLSQILTRSIRTSVERMGLGHACDSKRHNDCKRQGADQPSTRAKWPVPLLCCLLLCGFSNIL